MCMIAASARRVHKSSAARRTAKSGLGGMAEKPMRYARGGRAGTRGDVRCLTLSPHPTTRVRARIAKPIRIGNRHGFRTYLLSARAPRKTRAFARRIPAPKPGVDGALRRWEDSDVPPSSAKGIPRRPDREPTGFRRSFMTADILRQFMPYGAPDLQEAERPHLVRALALGSAIAISVFALAWSLSLMLVHPQGPVVLHDPIQ